MEFERTLFRVHERFLSIDAVKKSVDYCYKISIFIIAICLPIFLYGNYRFLNQSPCLQPLIQTEYILDPENRINETNLTEPLTKKIIRNDTLVIIKIADLSKSDTDLNDPKNLLSYFEFSGIPQVILMDAEIRKNHNFTTYNLTIDKSCYSTSFIENWIIKFLDYENIMINEIIVTFKGMNRFMKNTITSEPWSFLDSQIVGLTERENIFIHIFSRSLGILKLLLGIFLVSNITAIYNKMTIICAPIFILAAYSLCSHPSQRQVDRMNIYRAFPWIGMYLYTLNANGRKKDRYIIFAFFCMITIFYCLYLAALVFWNLLLFSKSFPKGLDENFYGFLALAEFLVLLFVRTRSTIKFLPKMSVITMLMFLYYVQYTPYGFYNIALFMMSWTILGLLGYFLKSFEIPGIDWNPSYHYTPSIDSPRTLFVPIFSLTWYHDLPQLWTMFFPMFGRSYFSSTELSMVNRNYPLLVSTLENAAQGVSAADNNQEENNQNGFDFPMQQIGNNNQGNQNNEQASPSNQNRPNQNNQPNLLQNADSDFVLDLSGGLGNDNRNNNRHNWSGEENSGNRYRRIDEP